MARLDRDTFDTLVRQHHAAVYRSARRVLRQDGDAEDIAQDVFLRLLAGKVKIGTAGPRASLCWLATRLALNARRGEGRRQSHQTHATTAEEPMTPEQDALRAEQQDSVRHLVNELPDELRLPVELRYQDGLTYAAVGSALSISESTAHDRVRNALERLRSALGRAGYAIAPAGLPELVAHAEPLAAPAGLEARLLSAATPGTAALAGTGVGAGAAKLVVAATLGIGLVAAGFAFALADGGPPSAVPAAALHTTGDDEVLDDDTGRADPSTEDPSRTLAAVARPAARESMQDPVARRSHVLFTGTVHDALAVPVAGARVVAVAAGNLKPFDLASTTTDGRGGFRLEVPLAARPVSARKIRIRVIDGIVLLETGEFALMTDPAGATVPIDPAPLALRLPESAGTEASRFELAVTVHDALGRAMAGVPVALYAADGDPPPRPGTGRAEASGTTDGDGIATLVGRKLGGKVLFADGRRLGLRAAVEPLPIDQPGPRRHTVELAPGLDLRARITTLDGTPPDFANVWLEDARLRLNHGAALGPAGAVEFRGLGDGPFTLRVSAHPFSPAAISGLRPDERDAVLEVRLKRADDPRDLGDHQAELHGRLIDAATGRLVPLEAHLVTARPVLDGDSTLPVDRVEPPRPMQRMIDHVRHPGFHLVGLAAGTWAVTADVPGFATAVQVVELREGELRAGLEIPLRRGARVSGRVVGADDGQGIAGALVFVVGLGPRADANVAAWAARRDGEDRERPPSATAALPSLLASSAVTAADGSFELRDVPPEARLRLVAVGATGHAPAETPALQLRPGELRRDVELRAPRR